MTKTEAIKSWFSRLVKEDVEDDISHDERVASIAIVVFGVLIGLYFVAHQTWSTGFFTATFGTLEMLLLYGSLIYWIVTSALMLFGCKNLSRDFDIPGLFLPLSALLGSLWFLPLILLILQTCCQISSDFWCSGFPTTSPEY